MWSCKEYSLCQTEEFSCHLEQFSMVRRREMQGSNRDLWSVRKRGHSRWGAAGLPTVWTAWQGWLKQHMKSVLGKAVPPLPWSSPGNGTAWICPKQLLDLGICGGLKNIIIYFPRPCEMGVETVLWLQWFGFGLKLLFRTFQNAGECGGGFVLSTSQRALILSYRSELSPLQFWPL